MKLHSWRNRCALTAAALIGLASFAFAQNAPKLPPSEPAGAAHNAEGEPLGFESPEARALNRNEDKLLKGKLVSTVMRKRTGAPMVLEAQFDYLGRVLLEGRIELTFRAPNGTKLQTCLSQDLALTTGRQAFRLMLPAVSAYGDNGQVTASMRFISVKGRIINLGESSVPVPNRGERAFAIGVGETLDGGAPVPEQSKLAASLRFERFDPTRAEAGSARTITTSLAYVPTDDFPVLPVAYCQFDLVFLQAAPFAALREKQLDALTRWVEAGGSLIVLPGGALKDYHVQFLNQLAGTPCLQSDERGTVQALPGFPASGIGMYRTELGRVAIVLKSPDVEKGLDTPAWRGVAAFLWKARASQRTPLAEKGSWATDQQKDPYFFEGAQQYGRRYGNQYPSGGVQGFAGTPDGPQAIRFSPLPLVARDQLASSLMPKAIRLIPFGVVVTMLGIFLVVIGPLDYLGLGLLRRRKYTWALLPVVCIAFTATTVGMAAHYMGRNDSRQGVTIYDVGKGGRILRRNRCELIFPARQMTVSTTVENGLFADLTEGPSVGNPYGNAGPDSMPPVYDGRIPSAYQVRQEARQWTPQLNRCFSIDKSEPGTTIHWDAVDLAMLQSGDRAGIVQKLFGGRAFGPTVVLCNQYDARTIWGGGDSLAQEVHAEPYYPASQSRSFIQEVSVFPQRGLFSIISQLSPVGGNSFEDFAILDPTDEKQWLLVVVTTEKGEPVVYRRLYYE